MSIFKTRLDRAALRGAAMGVAFATTGALTACAGCNPCKGAKSENPCNPCKGAKTANPCNPCNPCSPEKKNPCNPCNPCGPK